MFASIRYLSLCVCGFVCLSTSAALAEGLKCTYWFGICMSCDAPLTCASVKRAQSKPTPKPARRRARRPTAPAAIATTPYCQGATSKKRTSRRDHGVYPRRARAARLAPREL